MKRLRIATRGSELARWQADFVRRAILNGNPGLEVELVVVTTRGDRVLDVALDKIPGKGLFTKEVQDALLDDRADLAVHSLKDLPTEPSAGLEIAAILAREDPADALVTRQSGVAWRNAPVSGGMAKSARPCLAVGQRGHGRADLAMPPESEDLLAELPRGAGVMTGAVRRSAQLLHRRPDLTILPARGNVPTRLRKFDESGADGIVLACAGLVRLGLGGRITHRLAPSEFLPACGQGALAVEIRAGNEGVRDLCRPLDDPATSVCVTAERAFLAALGGGCQAPIGAYATVGGARLNLTGMIAGLDGRRLVVRSAAADCPDLQHAQELGRRVAAMVKADGIEDLLKPLGRRIN